MSCIDIECIQLPPYCQRAISFHGSRECKMTPSLCHSCNMAVAKPFQVAFAQRPDAGSPRGQAFSRIADILDTACRHTNCATSTDGPIGVSPNLTGSTSHGKTTNTLDKVSTRSGSTNARGRHPCTRFFNGIGSPRMVPSRTCHFYLALRLFTENPQRQQG